MRLIVSLLILLSTVVKIYTKTGDNGTTGLFAGPRVAKNHVRIAAYGTVDELSAVLGCVAAGLGSTEGSRAVEAVSGRELLEDLLPRLQSDLFSIGAELATPEPDKHGMKLLAADRIAELESQIDQADSVLPALSSFILPGGTTTAAHLHLARTVCRRAERDIVSLGEAEPDCDLQRIIVYLNRLSDLLFVMARLENHQRGVADVPWERPSAD